MTLKKLGLYLLSFSLLVPSGSLPVFAQDDPQQNQATDPDTGEKPDSPQEPTNPDSVKPIVRTLDVASPTQQQIKDFITQHKAKITDRVTYATEPSLEEPYAAGVISDASNQSAINMINQIRFIAGISSNVSINKEYEKKVSAATLLNALNNKMTHTPSRPSVLSDPKYDSLYELGEKGAGSSNIASGYGTLNYAIVNGWMADEDSGNIDRVGHRRWVLNPKMSATGFGKTGSQTAMYSFDSSGTGDQKNIAWPAQNTPTAYFESDYPWSLSMPMDDSIKKDMISVQIKSLNTNRTWNFSSTHADGDFYYNTQTYGRLHCLIFRPSGLPTIRDGDKYEVTVTVDKEQPEIINYQVNFFKAFPKEITSLFTNWSSNKVKEGETFILEAHIYPQDADNTTLKYTSSDPEIATVDNKGKVTALKAGTATITVSTTDGSELSAVCEVTVLEKEEEKEEEPDKEVEKDQEDKDEESESLGNIPVYYPDIIKGSEFHLGSSYCKEKGLMLGYEDGLFHAYNSVTRGMVATILYRMAGEPYVSGSGFADVPEWSFYKKASTWAKMTGIMSGNGTTVKTFDGNDPVRRQDLALIFYRVSGGMGSTMPNSHNELAGNHYAFNAANWALNQNLIDPHGSGQFDGGASGLRGVTANLLQRYYAPDYGKE